MSVVADLPATRPKSQNCEYCRDISSEQWMRLSRGCHGCYAPARLFGQGSLGNAQEEVDPTSRICRTVNGAWKCEAKRLLNVQGKGKAALADWTACRSLPLSSLHEARR